MRPSASRAPASAPGSSAQQPPRRNGRSSASSARATASLRVEVVASTSELPRTPVVGSRFSPRIRTSRSPASPAPRAAATPNSRSAAGASSVPPERPTESIGTPIRTNRRMREPRSAVHAPELPAGDVQHLAVDVVRQLRREEEDGARRLGGLRRAPERDDHRRHSTLLLRDPELDLLAAALDRLGLL